MIDINFIDTEDNCPPEKCYIYALLDPRDESIRYIGKTSRGLTDRLYGHCTFSGSRSTVKTKCRNWVKSIISAGLKPEIKVIDVVDSDKWEDAEIFYIKLFRENGFKLTNILDGGAGYKCKRRHNEFKDPIAKRPLSVGIKDKSLILFNGTIVQNRVSIRQISEFLNEKYSTIDNAYRKGNLVLSRYFVIKNDSTQLISCAGKG